MNTKNLFLPLFVVFLMQPLSSVAVIDTKQIVDACKQVVQHKHARTSAYIAVGGVTLYLAYKNYSLNKENAQLKQTNKTYGNFADDVQNLLKEKKLLDEDIFKNIEKIKHPKTKDTQRTKELYQTLNDVVQDLNHAKDELEQIKTASNRSDRSEQSDDEPEKESTARFLLNWFFGQSRS